MAYRTGPHIGTALRHALPLALLLLIPTAFAEAPPEAEPAETAPAYSQAELDRMLAPIALYPDALLSQILMAATYPLEVVQAARWSRANPGLSGERAVEAVQGESWDPSVKALAAVPRVLAMMDEKLEWMQDLGDAFLAQPEQVADTIQGLRRRAYAAGNLPSGGRYRVEHRGGNIVIEPAEAHVVYVPYYDPRVVYGPWWWAGYPPVYWAPWPGYYAQAGSGFYWSVGVFVGPRFFFGFWDWPHRHIKVVHVHRHLHAHPSKFVHKVWHHDPRHRLGVKYRHVHVRKAYVSPRHGHHVHRHFRGHDARQWSHRPGDREHRDTPGRHEASRQLHADVGRLGMRHDRQVTSRHPNLPLAGSQIVSTPNVHRQAGVGDWRGHRPHADRRTAGRAHSSAIRAGPKWQAAAPPRARTHVSAGPPRTLGRTPRAAPVHPKVSRVAPAPKTFRPSSTPARGFMPKFSAQAGFGGFRKH